VGMLTIAGLFVVGCVVVASLLASAGVIDLGGR
jgi:hypothetical protein